MQETASESPKRSLKRVRREVLPEQQVLTVPQAAKISGLTERATWLAIYRKRFPHRRIGRKVVVLRADLEKFLHALPGVSAEEAEAKATEVGGASSK
jgi:predicted DNA-binding transcriptional regulator AlpA